MFTVRNFLDTKCHLQSVEIACKDKLYLDPGADGQLFQHFSIRKQEECQGLETSRTVELCITTTEIHFDHFKQLTLFRS